MIIRKKYINEAVVFVAYIIIATIMTFPLILRSSTDLPGEKPQAGLFAWNIYQFAERTNSLQNPLATKDIFYPVGANLVTDSYLPLHDLIAWLPAELLGFIPAVNFLILLLFSLCGLFTYLLARRLTNSIPSAFIAGLIFAFCPMKIANLSSNLNLLATGMIPLNLLFVYRYFSADGKRSDAIMAAVVLFAAFMTDIYFFLFIGILYLMFFWHRIYSETLGDRRRKFFYKSGWFLSYQLIGIIPVAAILIWAALESGPLFPQGWSDLTVISADFASWFVPPVYHSLWGDSFAKYYGHLKIPPTESTLYIGLSVVVLVALAVTFYAKATREIRFWRLALVVFFVLAHGPILTVSGASTGQVAGFNFAIPLPFAAFYYIDFLRPFHLPVRFAVIVYLSAGILAAFAVNRLLDVVDTPRRRIIMATSLCGVLMLEYLPAPIKTSQLKVPEIYKEIAHEEGTLLELPFGVADRQRRLGADPTLTQIGQISHGRPLIGGMLSDVRPSTFERLASTPIINTIVEIQNGSGYPVEDVIESDKEKVARFRRYFDLRNIVFRPRASGGQLQEYIDTIFADSIEKTEEEDGFLYYKLKPVQPWQGQPIDFGDHFFSDLMLSGFQTRLINMQGREVALNWRNKSAIKLPVNGAGQYHLTLTLRASNCERKYLDRITISSTEQTIGQYDLPKAWRELKLSMEISADKSDQARLTLGFANGDAICPISNTGISINGRMLAIAGSQKAGAFSHVLANNRECNSRASGACMLAISPQTGEVVVDILSRPGDNEEKAKQFAESILNLRPGLGVAIALNGCNLACRRELMPALEYIGAQQGPCSECGYAIIGGTDAVKGSAIEENRSDLPASVVVGDFVEFDRLIITSEGDDQ